MSSRFTEDETEKYYDSEDAVYRAFWDEDGSVHWGLFDETTGNDFLKACANLDRFMVEKGRITPESKVLDLGCIHTCYDIPLLAICWSRAVIFALSRNS